VRGLRREEQKPAADAVRKFREHVARHCGTVDGHDTATKSYQNKWFSPAGWQEVRHRDVFANVAIVADDVATVPVIGDLVVRYYTVSPYDVTVVITRSWRRQ